MSTEIELRPVDYSKTEEQAAADKLKQLEAESSPSQSANDSTVSSTDSTTGTGDNKDKDSSNKKTSSKSSSSKHHQKKDKHHYHHHHNATSVHQYDSKIMGGFYEACVAKFNELYPTWTESWQLKGEKPLMMSQKHLVHERMIKLMKDNQEPAIVLQNFDYGDILNFEKFLQMLKQDGVNSISKFKQYLINKDMKKLDLDLVIIHAKYGIMLVDIKECDYLDSKRRSKAKVNLNNARQSIENLIKLIVDAKGLNTPVPAPTPVPVQQQQQQPTPTPVDGTTPTTVPVPIVAPVVPATPTKMEMNQIPIMEVVALPNLREKPQQAQQQQQQQQSPNTRTTSNLRQLNYIVKADLETEETFKSWWKTTIVERLEQRQIKDCTLLNHLVGMFSCIRNNSILPVVIKEEDKTPAPLLKQQKTTVETTTTTTTTEQTTTTTTTESTPVEQKQEQPSELKYKLSVSGEFFHEKHEEVRSLSRVVVSSKDEDRIQRTVCMQILWLLLNDSQKKISVVCSEKSKAFYEEYFKLQRKLYNNLNNVRFYSDVQSCAINGTSHTLKKDGEIWFFDLDLNMSTNQSKDILDRIKELNAFWVYTQDNEWTTKCKTELDAIANLNRVNLDPQETQVQHRDGSLVTHVEIQNKPWVHGLHLRFPLRLQCDLLVIGDIVTPNQLKYLLRNFKTGSSSSNGAPQHQNQHHSQQHSQAAKRLKSIKFIRGGTIDNIRESIKMHDSIQAQVVLMHVGDEDVFKTRNAQATIDRVKELTQLVKEYCPKSFIVLSTLMRRVSKTENTVINDVNKGIIQFCKQARDSSNFFYMLNNHFDPEYHTYEGRVLSNKGLKLYVDNILFVVDYFLVKNNKQH